MPETPDNSAHKHAYDVTIEKIARVYAEAVLGAAEAKGSLDVLMDELAELVSGALDKNPKFEDLLATELISQDEKQEMLDRVFSGKLSETTLGLLHVLAQHNRLSILRDVIQSTISLWQQRCGHVAVEVQFACEPDQALRQEIAKALQTTLGADPQISTSVDPELLAGFVVRVGDKVYDASVRSGLERARQEMVARAYEAIQKRPEQFMQQ